MSLLSVRDLQVNYRTRAGLIQAVKGVSFDLARQETAGLVGESGCGKSTLGKALIRLVPISEGSIHLEGFDLANAHARELRGKRNLMQMVFQDPYGSLNPRKTVGNSIVQPLVIAGWQDDDVEARLHELLKQVGLPQNAADRYPHEFSGGQRQRIGIARALALRPKLIICDEPVSALDVSVRAQIINLLKDIQQETGVSYLFISHDLSVVEYVSDWVMVMYLGQIVETGTSAELWHQPLHPYTKALLSSAPIADPKIARARKKTILQGELPSAFSAGVGCPFHSRCPEVQPQCRLNAPELLTKSGGTQVACHLVN